MAVDLEHLAIMMTKLPVEENLKGIIRHHIITCGQSEDKKSEAVLIEKLQTQLTVNITWRADQQHLQ